MALAPAKMQLAKAGKERSMDWFLILAAVAYVIVIHGAQFPLLRSWQAWVGGALALGAVGQLVRGLVMHEGSTPLLAAGLSAAGAWSVTADAVQSQRRT